MALYIISYSNGDIVRHIPFDHLSFDPRVIDDVKYIQADGHELEAIKKVFEHCAVGTVPHAIMYSIPMPYDRRVVQWWGDIAKTILSNL